jgi:type I restriction enzyme S subunit
VLTTLGAVTDYGKTVKVEPQDIPAEAWVLELEDIEKDSSRILQRLSQSERQSLSTKNRFDAGDVLYGKLRPYLNKVVIADAPGFSTTEIVPVRAGAALERRYLFHWLKNPAFLKYVEAASHGMNMPRLGADAGRAAPLVLAPRPEQTRIADQLDTLLARIQACQDRLEAIPALLKRFRQAVLRAAVNGDLTASISQHEESATQVVKLGEDELVVPASWQVVALQQVIDPARPLCYGVVQPGAETSNGVALIRVQDMESGTVLKSQLRTVAPVIDVEYRRSRVVGGEVLVSVVGTIGRTSVVPQGLSANIARAVARIACREDVSGLWVHYWLSTDAVQWHLLNSAKEVARKTLNLSDLARIPIALPGPAEQSLIVEKVGTYLRLANKIESIVEVARGKSQRLAPLTLAKAFRGELAPQDPNDEPASALLARIAAQRDSPSDVAVASVRRRGRPPRAPKETATMTKSRQDDDVMGQPYLAGHLRRIGMPASAEVLFKVAELPVADFYKQLAWEVAQGHVKDNQTALEPGHAAG